jgi:hypothetical protein
MVQWMPDPEGVEAPNSVIGNRILARRRDDEKPRASTLCYLQKASTMVDPRPDL